MRLAYLLSPYPCTSQVFVQREVLGLRARAVEVVTISVRRSTEVRSPADRAEAATTRWLVPAAPIALLRAHLRAARRPRAWLGTLLGAVRDGPPGRRAKQVVYWGEAVLLWDMLRRDGIDHVHVHFALNASDVALIAARLGRAQGEGPRSFSVHFHGPTDFFDIEGNRVGLKALEASGVICISDFARAQVLSRLPVEAWDRVHVARYGAPVDDGAAAQGVPGTPFRVLTVGRLASVKGQPVLLSAIAALVAAGHDVQLDIVGEGPLRRDLERLADELGIAERVRWHGALGHDAVAERYRQADVFCLPSFAEGLPVVVLEAMAAGVPVVATAITGVPEAIEHERHGLLVRPGRVDELVTALSRLADEPALRSALGLAARARIVDELSDAASAAQIHAALEQIVPASNA